MNEVIYNPPQTSTSYLVATHDNEVRVTNDRSESCFLHLNPATQTLEVRDLQIVGQPELLIGVALEHVFSADLNRAALLLRNGGDSITLPNLQEFATGENQWTVPRVCFFQQPHLWLRDTQGPRVENWIRTGDKLHPKRTKPAAGVLYRRNVAGIQAQVSFRTIDCEKDLDLFHLWHNKPRVADLWELAKPKSELQEYLRRSERDPHQISIILEFNGVPAGYFEMYWAAEDRIAPYCDATAFDRGFHFLIGEDDFLGLDRTRSVVESVCHYLFLDELRTRRIVAEPRADNRRVIKYAEIIPGWNFDKEFDFPHKRAALLTCHREGFFMGRTL